MRPYNPCLKGMVDNYRAKAQALGIDAKPVTDEQLYELIDSWAGAATAEEQESAVMDSLRECQRTRIIERAE